MTPLCSVLVLGYSSFIPPLRPAATTRLPQQWFCKRQHMQFCKRANAILNRSLASLPVPVPTGAAAAGVCRLRRFNNATTGWHRLCAERASSSR